MPIWISKQLCLLLVYVGLVLPLSKVQAEVVTHFQPNGRQLALTFDACEARGQPALLDMGLVAVLQREQIPFTLFVSGLFLQRNQQALQPLLHSPLVEVENHSWDHPAHMQRLPVDRQMAQLHDTGALIQQMTGRSPTFFRFPGGNYDAAALALVEQQGYRVVHWRWPSGDPAPGLRSADLQRWVRQQTRSGDILIFHINSRAPASAAALAELIPIWRQQGYQFVRLDQVLR